MLNADLIFWPVLLLLAACNLYFGPLIRTELIAMQWGFDGKPTRYASKAVGLWSPVALALGLRLLIWVLSTNAPSRVHGAETGVLLLSVIIAVSQAVVIRKAMQAG